MLAATHQGPQGRVRHTVTAVAVAIGIVGMPLAARAQIVDRDLRVAMQGVSLGTPLRVSVTPDEGLRTGNFLGLDDRGLLLEETPNAVSVIAPGQIMRLTERRRAWRKGLWIGAGAGVVVGALLGGALAGIPCDSCGPRDVGDDVVSSALAGGLSLGLLGGGVGVLIGSSVREWHVLVRFGGS